MDRIRRSIRQSFRRSKKSPASSSAADGTTTSQPPQWSNDEVAVRAGNCSFQVKYLGCIEVFESRGMQICEEALKQLRNSGRKSQRAVLHISGDGLRVVDATSSQLIVDQTIEKVSFARRTETTIGASPTFVVMEQLDAGCVMVSLLSENRANVFPMLLDVLFKYVWKRSKNATVKPHNHRKLKPPVFINSQPNHLLPILRVAYQLFH